MSNFSKKKFFVCFYNKDFTIIIRQQKKYKCILYPNGCNSFQLSRNVKFCWYLTKEKQ